MHKTFLILGTILAGLAVALGAFGAHGLKKFVNPEAVASYQTGVQYQMYHALALLLVGLLAERFNNSGFNYTGFLFVGGIVLFSGSLYLIASLKAMNREIIPAIGILTPVGGLFFILGWVILLVTIIRR